MSHRLQVLIPEELEERIGKEARRRQISKGEFVRWALVKAVGERRSGTGDKADPLELLASIQAPTADIEEMIAEIEAGRR